MIFISHSSKNEDIVKEIKSELEKNFYKCFLSSDDLKPGDDWHDEIWKNLKCCDAFLALVTVDFNKSAFCQQELGAAYALDKPILTILHGDVPQPPGFAARFQSCKRGRLVSHLEQQDDFRPARVAAWIESARTVNSFQAANDAYDRFGDDWSHMTDKEKREWFAVARNNNQITGEGFKVGVFYNNAKNELEASLKKARLQARRQSNTRSGR